MKLTNNQIYTYAIQMTEAFNDASQRLPMKINFYLQKNKATLMDLAQSIENSRMDIIKTYGVLVDEESGKYSIPTENATIVQKEMTDLGNLEQEANIYTISADSLTDDISLTTAQMEALMFMID